jgi:transaldolase/glucose-6-phosphate isomerase
MAGVPDMVLSIGAYMAQVDAVLTQGATEQKSKRLWQGDATIWTGKDEGRWLGWLHCVPNMLAQVDELKQFGEEIKNEGFTDVLLLGMGGSSLCPEVLSETYGSVSGYPVLHVLDSTVPEQVMRFKESVDLKNTLCVVASKSGTTTEPNAFCAYFWHEMQKAVGTKAGSHFVAITDPGSALQKWAEENQFRQIFKGVPEIGGRFSALSLFGLVPAALIGLDLRDFLTRAKTMTERCGPDIFPGENPGVVLGSVLGCLAKQGRDKVTLVTSPNIWDFGAWLEQLIAESTGKNGVGLVPIDQESLALPDVYGTDRVFVYIRIKNAHDEDRDRQIAELKNAGHPVIEIHLDSPMALGAEFFRWEMATAVAGAVLGIHPFDQPNVQESKDFTAKLTKAYESSGKLPEETPVVVDDGIHIFADETTLAQLGNIDSLEDCLLAHLGLLQPHDYVAICAFIDMSEKHVAFMQTLRHAIRDRYRVATTLGFGPRFLHSTGQLHKGGGNNVLVLQITAENTCDPAIPGRGFTFGILKDAQAIGDAHALISRNRRLIRVHHHMDLEAGFARFIQIVS